MICASSPVPDAQAHTSPGSPVTITKDQGVASSEGAEVDDRARAQGESPHRFAKTGAATKLDLASVESHRGTVINLVVVRPTEQQRATRVDRHICRARDGASRSQVQRAGVLDAGRAVVSVGVRQLRRASGDDQVRVRGRAEDLAGDLDAVGTTVEREHGAIFRDGAREGQLTRAAVLHRVRAVAQGVDVLGQRCRAGSRVLQLA